MIVGLTVFEDSPWDLYKAHYGYLAAYDRDSGKLDWQNSFNRRPFDLAAGPNDELYLLDSDAFSIISATNGSGLWSYPRGFSRERVGNVVVGSGGYVYFSTGSGIVCIDAPKRRVHFYLEYSPLPVNWITLGPENRLFVSVRGKIVAIDSVLGGAVWEKSFGWSYPPVQPFLNNQGELIVIGGLSNNPNALLIALDPRTGRDLWSQTISYPEGRIVTDQFNSLYFYGGFGGARGLIKYDSVLGEQQWQATVPATSDSETGPIALAGNLLFWGSFTNLYLFDAVTGNVRARTSFPYTAEDRWTTWDSSTPSANVDADGYLYAFSGKRIRKFGPVGSLARSSCPKEDGDAQNTAQPQPVNSPLIFQFSDISALRGSNAVFEVFSKAIGTSRFQWYTSESQPLLGETNASLVLTNISAADHGRAFFVVVKDGDSDIATTSRVAQVSVLYKITRYAPGGSIETTPIGDALPYGTTVKARASHPSKPFLGWLGTFQHTLPEFTFTLTNDVELHALFPVWDGDLIWRQSFLDERSMSLLISKDNQRVFVITDHNIYTLDTESGTVLWSRGSSGTFHSAGYANNTMYTVSRGALVSGDPADSIITAWTIDGASKWTQRFGGYGLPSPVALDGNGHVIGGLSTSTDSGAQVDTLFSLSAATGEILWQLGHTNAFMKPPSVVGSSVITLVGSNMHSFSASTGTLQWSIPGAASAPLFFSGGRVAFLTAAFAWFDTPRDSEIVEADVYSGEILRRILAPGWLFVYPRQLSADPATLFNYGKLFDTVTKTAISSGSPSVVMADGSVLIMNESSLQRFNPYRNSTSWSVQVSQPERLCVMENGDVLVFASGALSRFRASVPMANTAWPSEHADAQNTRRARIDNDSLSPRFIHTIPDKSTINLWAYVERNRSYSLESSRLATDGWNPETRAAATNNFLLFQLTNSGNRSFYRLKRD